MWFIHWKMISVAWKNLEVKTARQELCNVWIALSILLGAFSSQRQCLWASDTCPLSLKDNPGEVCSLVAAGTCGRAQVSFHCCTSQHVPAFPCSHPSLRGISAVIHPATWQEKGRFCCPGRESVLWPVHLLTDCRPACVSDSPSLGKRIRRTLEHTSADSYK